MAKDVVYYGNQITPNKVATKDGYVICMNVPIARTGIQQYLDTELISQSGIRDVIKPGINNVMRDESEVFNEKTIASFEGVPITDNHPSGGLVTSETWNQESKGVVTNVRRGTGEDSDKLVADLHINDKSLVTMVEGKIKEQVSCGYRCDWINDNGVIKQTNIRGNHVAIVNRGRAGNEVAIKDELPEISAIICDKPCTESEVSNNIMDILSKVLSGVFGKESQEKIEAAVDIFATVNDSLNTVTEDAKPEDKKEDKAKDKTDNKDLPKDEEKEDKKDTKEDKDDEPKKSTTDAIESMLNDFKSSMVDEMAKLKDYVDAAMTKDEDMVKKSEESAKESAKDLEELYEKAQSKVDDSMAKVVSDHATILEVVSAMKEPIAAIKNDKDRTMVSDSLLNLLNAIEGTESVEDTTTTAIKSLVGNVANDSYVNNIYGIGGVTEQANIENNYYKKQFESKRGDNQ